MDSILFLRQFVRHPRKTSAVAPSSTVLARLMTEWIDWPNANAVVEYGPGTGVFTRRIVEQLRPGARFFAIELNDGFVTHLSKRLPDVTVHHDSVANVRAVCDGEGVEQVDAIISGLGWADFPEPLQRELLGAMMTVLRPGGQFTTFAYLHGLGLGNARRFRGLLREYFSEVAIAGPVWRNVPPAIAYRCRR
jgi:phospholipid N-methyltransferase